MIEKYGLFDSVEGDERVYAEGDFASLVMSLGLDGVRGSADALKVSPLAGGLGVNVGAGRAVVQGRYYALEDDGGSVKTLALTAAAVNPRIDRIVLCLNFGARTIVLGVLTGTEAASPVPPALERSAAQYMLSLAQVRVGVGAAALQTADITDERADEALCGLHVHTAQAAMNRAQEALGAAGAAQAGADAAAQAAAAAQQTANTGVSRADAALGEAQKRIVQVSGAQEGELPLLTQGGGLASSGVLFSAFTLAKMTLSDTTLTITTVS